MFLLGTTSFFVFALIKQTSIGVTSGSILSE